MDDQKSSSFSQPRQQKPYRNKNGYQNGRGRGHHSWHRQGAVPSYPGQTLPIYYEFPPRQRTTYTGHGNVYDNVSKNTNDLACGSSRVSGAANCNGTHLGTKAPSSTSSRDGNGQVPTAGQAFLAAAKTGDLPAIDRLLQQHHKGGKHSISQNHLNASLLEACRMGRKFIVQKLVRLGAEVSVREFSNCITALHIAAEQGFVDIADFLLIKGANVNALDHRGNSPLILAVNSAGSCDMLNLLLAHKAKLHYQNSTDMTALMKAVDVMDIDAVRILMFAGSNLKQKCRHGKTARDLAVRRGIADVYDFLKNEMEERSGHSYPARSSALTKAMMGNRKEAVQILLDSRISKIKEKPQPLYKQANESIKNATLKELIKVMCSAPETKKPDGAKIEIAQILLANGAQPEKGTRSEFSSALIDATRSGIYDLVKVVSSSGNCNPNFLYNGCSALMVAAEKGRLDIIQLLLRIGADPKLTNNRGEMALSYALSHSQIECAKFLLQRHKPSKSDLQKMVRKAVKGCQLEALTFLASHCNVNEISQTLLKEAVLSGDSKVVHFLVDHGADICEPCDDSRPAFLVVLSSKEIDNLFDMVMYLVQNGACVNRTGTEDSPLVTAVENNCSLDMLRYLLEQGADVNEVGTDDGTTPLISAFNLHPALSGIRHPDMLELLLEAGADPNKAKSNGDTALHLAVSEGNPGVIRQLIDAGADLEARNSNGLTPLLLATNRGEPNVISLLKRCGANIKVADSFGKSALIRLFEKCSSPQEESVRLLVYDQDHLNTQAPNGLTPLMAAADATNLKAIKIFFELGADPHVVDKKESHHQTALSIVIDSLLLKRNSIPCIKELILQGALCSLPKRCFLPLYHMFMADNRELVQLLVTHGMPPLCIDFVAIGGYSFNTFMMGISNATGRKLSPLAAALVRNRVTVARYVVQNWFLSYADVVGREELHGLKAVLENTSKSQSLSFLEEYMSQPMSLVQLSFVAVSSQLGDIAGREERVRKLPLPPILQDKLLYKKELYPMEFRAVDENFPEGISSADEVDDDDDEDDSLTSDYSDNFYGSQGDLDAELYGLDYEDVILF